MQTERIYQLVGNAMKGVRRSAHLKQADLATVLGLSRGAIANMETGRQRMTLETIQQFCDYFEIPMHTLFEAIDQARRTP